MQRNSYDKTNDVNIKVIVRCRPLNEKEKNDINHEEVVKIKDNEIKVILNRNNDIYEKKYTFDYVCDQNVDQKTLFDNYIFQIVDEVLKGFNCTLFCYGQTGTGKTYTMEGRIYDMLKQNDKKFDLNGSVSSDVGSCYEIFENEDTGLIFRVIKRIFEFMNDKKHKKKKKEIKENEIDKLKKRETTYSSTSSSRVSNASDSNLLNMNNDIYDELDDKTEYDFNIKVSYLEIYNEELCDLLSPINEGNKLRIYEDSNKSKGLNVDKLEEKNINSFEDIYFIICSAIKKRRTADTNYNKKSSRSHSIFTITITIKYVHEGESITKIGKLNLVDLAGSENAIKNYTGNYKVRQQESCNINQSLLTLGRVINALVENSSYIPYRDSKLTRLLQDSLGGKTKTFIVATISPSSVCVDETLSTLDYVFRAKNIKNKPEINVRSTNKIQIHELENEIENLKKALILTREKKGVYLDNEEYYNMQNSFKKNKDIILEKEKVIFEKSRKIQNLLAKIDDSDDKKKQLLSLSKKILSKIENMELFHDMLINKIVEEKYINSYLIEEYNRLNQQMFQNKVSFKESQKNMLKLFYDNIFNIKKEIENKNNMLNEICNNIIMNLDDIKKYVNEDKEVLLNFLNSLQNVNNHNVFKKKEFLNFFLDHLDIIQEYDNNYFFTIENIKKSILNRKIKLLLNKNNFTLENLRNGKIKKHLNENKILNDCKIEETNINENIKKEKDYILNNKKCIGIGLKKRNSREMRMSNMSLSTDNENLTDTNKYEEIIIENEQEEEEEADDDIHKENENKIYKPDYNINELKEFVINEKGVELFEKLNDLSNEKFNIEFIINYIKNIMNFFENYFKSAINDIQIDIKEKNELLHEETKNIFLFYENFHDKFNNFEEEINNKNENIINTFKKDVEDEIKSFQDNLLEEIKQVVAKNINNINDKINEKFESLTVKINNKTKEEYKNYFMDSFKNWKLYFDEYTNKILNNQKHYNNINVEFKTKIEKYYNFLNNILIELNNEIIKDEKVLENNIKHFISIYDDVINKNNIAVEKIAKNFFLTANNNISEKNELYKMLSKKVFEEKNEIQEEEEKANTYVSEYNEHVKTYNNIFVKEIEKFHIHVNDLMKNIQTNYFNNINDFTKMDDLQIEINEKSENIKNIIDKIRDVINTKFIHLKDENIKENNEDILENKSISTCTDNENIKYVDNIINSNTNYNNIIINNKDININININDIYNINNNDNINNNNINDNIINNEMIETNIYENYIKNGNIYLETKKNTLKEIDKIYDIDSSNFKNLYEILNENSDFEINKMNSLNEKLLSNKYNSNNYNDNFTTTNDNNNNNNTITNNNNNNNNNNNSNDYTNTTTTNNNNNDYTKNNSNNYIKYNNNNLNIEINNINNKVIKNNIKKNTINNINNKNIKKDCINNVIINNNNNINKNIINNKNNINNKINMNINENIRNKKNSNYIPNKNDLKLNNLKNINENKKPNNKIKTFDNNSKKNSPLLKRIKEDNIKNNKTKIPRKSK